MPITKRTQQVFCFQQNDNEEGEKSDDELAIPAQPAGNKRHAFAVAKHVTE